MTDFYPARDRLFWPVTVDTDHDTVSVVEDPGGGSEATITAQLTHTDQLANEASYFCYSRKATEDGGDTSTDLIIDGSAENIQIASLYAEIVSALRAESSASGNGLSYEITAIQPSGSDYDNVGLRLTHGGSLSIQLDFTASGHLDPRYFGFASDETTGGSGTSSQIDGPYSRWGVWYSPVTGHDQRPEHEQRTFRDSPHPTYHNTWRWGAEEIVRTLDYIGVAGVHVWPHDRASRATEAGRGGVPTGDANNALKHLWDKANVGDEVTMIGHGDGEGELGSTIGLLGSTTSFEAGRVSGEWGSTWAPQEKTDRDHAGEKYDLSIEYGAFPYEDYNNDVYRH